MGMGLGLGNQVAISTRGGNNLAGVENGHNTGHDVQTCYVQTGVSLGFKIKMNAVNL